MKIKVSYYRRNGKLLKSIRGEVSTRGFNPAIRYTPSFVINEALALDEQLLRIHCQDARKVVIEVEK